MDSALQTPTRMQGVNSHKVHEHFREMQEFGVGEKSKCHADLVTMPRRDWKSLAIIHTNSVNVSTTHIWDMI